TLLGVGYVKLAADVADAEGGKPGRQVGVGEGAETARTQGDHVEVRVEDIDRALAEIGGVEEIARAVVAEGQPLVDRTIREVGVIHSQDGVRPQAGVPGGEGAVLGGEDEASRAAADGE